MGRPPIGKTAMTDAERMRRYRLRRGKDEPVTKHVTKQASAAPADEALVKEVAVAKAEIAALKAELARTVAVEESDEIAALRDEVFALKTTLEAYANVIQTREGIYTRAQFTKITKSTHPDTRKSVDDETANAAFRLVWSRRYALVSEAEMPTKGDRLSLQERKDHAARQKRRAKAKREASLAKRRGQNKPSPKPVKDLSKT